MNAPVNQPSWLPTRKLSAALIAAAAMEVLHPILVQWVPMLGGPATGELLTLGVAAVAGYFIRDLPNA